MPNIPTDPRDEDGYTDKVNMYAARFLAETGFGDDPEPTPENMRKRLAGCAIAAPDHMYHDIRAEVFRQLADFRESGDMTNGGQVGGEIQSGESKSRRWIARNEHGIYCVVDFYAYPAKEDPETVVYCTQCQPGHATTAGTCERHGRPIEGVYRFDPWVQVQVWVTIVAKLGRTDEQEVSADVFHWDGYGRDPGDTAESVCRSLNLEDVRAAVEQSGL